MGRRNRYFWNSYCDTDIYTYNSSTIFFRPILYIEFDPENESNTFAPAAAIGRKFLKIRVPNDGKSTAHDCEATVKVIIPPNTDSRKFPSDDEKKLVWGLTPTLSDLKDTVNIKKNSSMLYVVFADSRFPSVQVQEGTRYASFSTMDALLNQAFAVHDTFSEGEFEISISINAEETNTKGRFKVYVDTNHLNLRMNMLPEPTKAKSIKSKILNIFK